MKRLTKKSELAIEECLEVLVALTVTSGCGCCCDRGWVEAFNEAQKIVTNLGLSKEETEAIIEKVRRREYANTLEGGK